MRGKNMTKEMRPTCINHGCDYQVAHSGTRWRPVCSRCHQAGYGKGTYREGVTPFRTGKCSNQKGHLGFTCPIDYEKSSWVIGHTQIDHVDGNHLNNITENCQELCDICHKEKGKRNGDFKEQYKYKYKLKKVA
tara:strand:- start:733 stop:1134 length:402 start_codon:yes stop_codon:yes gene_type:complete